MSTITFQPYQPGTLDADGKRIGSIDPRLTRTNYYDGQLLKASDLTRDQIYVDERLLELGQALGSGIAWGLETELVDEHTLRVQPGQAIAPSGRVLRLSKTSLEINLQDSALIASLNQGYYRRFQRGLYAVTLQFAEIIDGTAEAYPADLTTARRMQVSSYAEGVELTLVPLNLPLPRGDGMAVRAALAREFLAGGQTLNLPTDEAIPLGLLAIDQARPLWLDLGLLRRPLRQPYAPDSLQRDVAGHYGELLTDVLAARQAGGLTGPFPAAQYFRILPPVGSIPKDCINPVTGSQTFFPQEYEVSIAPVRKEDLRNLQEESVRLPVMDLEKLKDADIMVLVPLEDQDFALRARQLELPAQATPGVTGTLARLNSLALRIFPLPPVHKVDTDKDVWQSIWDAVKAEDLVYVRRPPRTAETNVSAIVLAQGFALPAKPAYTPNQLEQELDAAVAKRAADAASIAQLQADLAEAKRSDLLKQYNDAMAKATSLQADLDAKNAALTKAQSDLTTAQADATSKASQITKLQSDLNAKTNALTKAQNDLATAQADATGKAGLLAKAQSDLAAAQTDVANKTAQLAKAQTDYAALQADLAAKTTALTKAQNDYATLQAAQSNVSKLQSDLTAAQTDLASKTSLLNKAQAELTSTKASLNTTQATLLTAQNELATTKTTLNTTQTNLTSAQSELASTKLNLTGLQTTLNTTQINLTSVQSELASTKLNLTGLQTTLTSTQATLNLRLNIKATSTLADLATLRGWADTATANRLDTLLTDDPNTMAAIHIFAVTDKSMDDPLWLSLLQAATKLNGVMTGVRDTVFTGLKAKSTVPKIFVANATSWGIAAAQLTRWKALAV